MVAERLIAIGCPVVLGNADALLITGKDGEHPLTEHQRIAADWSVAQLGGRGVAAIESFQPTVKIELPDQHHLLCFHGSPTSFSDIAATRDERRRRSPNAWTVSPGLSVWWTYAPAAATPSRGFVLLQPRQRWPRLEPASAGDPAVGRPVGGVRDPDGHRVQCRRCVSSTSRTMSQHYWTSSGRAVCRMPRRWRSGTVERQISDVRRAITMGCLADRGHRHAATSVMTGRSIHADEANASIPPSTSASMVPSKRTQPSDA